VLDDQLEDPADGEDEIINALLTTNYRRYLAKVERM
jgi:hypothetical protein